MSGRVSPIVPRSLNLYQQMPDKVLGECHPKTPNKVIAKCCQ